MTKNNEKTRLLDIFVTKHLVWPNTLNEVGILLDPWQADFRRIGLLVE